MTYIDTTQTIIPQKKSYNNIGSVRRDYVIPCPVSTPKRDILAMAHQLSVVILQEEEMKLMGLSDLF